MVLWAYSLTRNANIRTKKVVKYLVLADSNIIRSRRLEVFFRKGVLRNFAKFTGKRPCQSLFF